MPMHCDLEGTKMLIDRKNRSVKIGEGEGVYEHIYYFTEVDDLEEVIEDFQRMLKRWRKELNLEPVKDDE